VYYHSSSDVMKFFGGFHRCIATSGLLYCTRPCNKHRVPITLCMIVVASDTSICLSKARCLAPAFTQRHCLGVPNAARNSPHAASRRLTQAYRVNRQLLMISCQPSQAGTTPSGCAIYEISAVITAVRLCTLLCCCAHPRRSTLAACCT